MTRRTINATSLGAVLAALCALVVVPSAAQANTTTRAAIGSLRAGGKIDRAEYRRASRSYDRAVAAVDLLRGARKRELRGVVADIDVIAAQGRLSAGTLPAVTLTLDHNRSWWTRRPMLRVGARIEFGRSELLWQHYGGHGIQIQWLATFGKANSLWRQKRPTRLRRLLDEALRLAAPRGPGIAWQYMFSWGGGGPLWVSGLAQGTAMSALTHGATYLHEPKYRVAAHEALGIFRVAPPRGVRVVTEAGAHYVQYSNAPKLRVLNGFVQALNGLSDVARASRGKTMATRLLRNGDAQALIELPSFDTGGWSRYSNRGNDSNLAYHRVLRDFLRGRCDRGGHRRYCRFAARLTADLHRPPSTRIVLPRRKPRQARLATLRIVLDKPASTTIVIRGRRDRRTIAARMASGSHRIGWRPPRAGPYTVTVAAVDPRGNRARTASIVHVRR